MDDIEYVKLIWLKEFNITIRHIIGVILFPENADAEIDLPNEELLHIYSTYFKEKMKYYPMYEILPLHNERNDSIILNRLIKNVSNKTEFKMIIYRYIRIANGLYLSHEQKNYIDQLIDIMHNSIKYGKYLLNNKCSVLEECNICNEYKHLLKLQCNHTICLTCYASMTHEYNMFICPFCRQEVEVIQF